MSLRCEECATLTRHALLQPEGAAYRDYLESKQRIALGAPDGSDYGHLTDVERVRREYREMPFPRNPNLRHRYWTQQAKEAWDDGSKQVVALCGEPIAIERNPHKKKKKLQDEELGYLVAETFSDIEYEDIDTGLSWVDMDCVDCCRVSNENYWQSKREWVEKALAWYARHPEDVDSSVFAALYDVLNRVTAVREKRDKRAKKTNQE